MIRPSKLMQYGAILGLLIWPIMAFVMVEAVPWYFPPVVWVAYLFLAAVWHANVEVT